MKKAGLSSLFLFALMLMCSIFVFTSCDIGGHEHTMGAWYTITEATCTTEGENRRDCNTCDYYDTVTIPPIGHAYNSSFGACDTCGKFASALAYERIGNGYCITGIGTCTDTDILIPATINSLPVTSIGGTAFYDCDSLTSVSIPDSVTSIGDFAFSDCSGLTSVTMPGSVTSIGDFAFSDCSGLTSVTMPGSVTSIGDGAFRYCNSLKSITIPDSVTSIGDAAFSDCSELTNIDVQPGNTEYHSSGNCLIETKSKTLIWGCNGLTSIALPYSVTSIGDWAFAGCDSLKSIAIPDSVTSIGDATFYGCSGLTSISIPNSVTSIGDAAFYGCVALTSITVPNGISFIGDYTFYDCKSLTGIAIPDSVTSIGDSAFKGCSGLTSIIIPNSVTSIGFSAFDGCDSLTSVYYVGTAEAWGRITIKSGNANLTNATRYYYSETAP